MFEFRSHIFPGPGLYAYYAPQFKNIVLPDWRGTLFPTHCYRPISEWSKQEARSSLPAFQYFHPSSDSPSPNLVQDPCRTVQDPCRPVHSRAARPCCTKALDFPFSPVLRASSAIPTAAW